MTNHKVTVIGALTALAMVEYLLLSEIKGSKFHFIDLGICGLFTAFGLVGVQVMGQSRIEIAIATIVNILISITLIFMNFESRNNSIYFVGALGFLFGTVSGAVYLLYLTNLISREK